MPVQFDVKRIDDGLSSTISSIECTIDNYLLNKLKTGGYNREDFSEALPDVISDVVAFMNSGNRDFRRHKFHKVNVLAPREIRLQTSSIYKHLVKGNSTLGLQLIWV